MAIEMMPRKCFANGRNTRLIDLCIDSFLESVTRPLYLIRRQLEMPNPNSGVRSLLQFHLSLSTSMLLELTLQVLDENRCLCSLLLKLDLCSNPSMSLSDLKWLNLEAFFTHLMEALVLLTHINQSLMAGNQMDKALELQLLGLELDGPMYG